MLNQDDICFLTLLLGCVVSFFGYQWIGGKNALYLRKYVLLAGIASFGMVGAFEKSIEAIDFFFAGWLLCSLVQLVLVREKVKRKLVAQLLDGQRPKYQGLSKQYDWKEFTWKETKRLCDVLKEVFTICSWHFKTQETELAIAIRKDANEHIEVGIDVKQLAERLDAEKASKMEAQMEAMGRLSHNIHVGVCFED